MEHQVAAVHHINLDTQEKAVKQFFLSLPVDPQGSLVEVNGRAVARLVPLPVGDNGTPGGESRWTEEKDTRRCFLIDREIDGTLTPEEARELEALQRQMSQHLDRVAPLPLEETRRLYQRLAAKAEAAHHG
jgi:hypothetical protein